MNRERAKELLGHLPIIQAFAEGKEIEYKSGNGDWKIIHSPDFAEPAIDRYRIKPEPFECWVLADPSDGELTSCYDNEEKAEAQAKENNAFTKVIHMREVE